MQKSGVFQTSRSGASFLRSNSRKAVCAFPSFAKFTQAGFGQALSASMREVQLGSGD